jgi:transcriptional regulator with XRE-family HTH domain
MVDNISIMKDETSITSANPDINTRVAQRVRALRAARGLTLEALAAQSGVSRSMLSLIERGESSPTAVVLDKVATALGVPLAALFDDARAPANPLARRADHPVWRDPQSGYVRRNLSPPAFPSPIHVVEVILPAGASVAYETGARAETIHQQIWVQAGSIDLSVGETTYHLTPDDCLAMQLNAPTLFRNPTHEPARYIVVIVNEGWRGTGRSYAA